MFRLTKLHMTNSMMMLLGPFTREIINNLIADCVTECTQGLTAAGMDNGCDPATNMIPNNLVSCLIFNYSGFRRCFARFIVKQYRTIIV